MRSRRKAAPATKRYIQFGIAKQSLGGRLLGLAFGLPFALFGTIGVAHSNDLGFIIALGFVLIGYPVVLGALGNGSLEFSEGSLKLRSTLLGFIPLFRWTLAGKGDVIGLRYIRRIETFQNAEGVFLDEHFLVLATKKANDYVLEYLGAHPSSLAHSIQRRANEIAT